MVEGFLTVKLVLPAYDSGNSNKSHQAATTHYLSRRRPGVEPAVTSLLDRALFSALQTGTTWETRGSQRGFQASRKPALWL
ncbi:hypothetical protein [Levilactobacillus lindianensis]|uniref:hypothetical protein n=1 Tax=Levilactobacillus lindianensis TaxID=2486018 RepID=UPI000F739DD8|nr:hypothetical protein [Levilactobacillus lindianensis]